MTTGFGSARELLYGRDDTPGIVSVLAGRDGRARVWRRVGSATVCEEARFPHWFLLADPTLLAALPVVRLPADALAELTPPAGGRVGLVELAGDLHYRYLVLAETLDPVEQAVVDAYNAQTGAAARSLYDLREAVYCRPPVEQYLIWTGRTYYKGLAYTDLRRLQFDLETTGLDRYRDRIFLIAVRDSTGFERVLEGDDEAALLREFVALVRARDPDIIENHNLFDFDIPFLVQRASRLRVPLALGRDGSEFTKYEDLLKVGEKSERFTRWCLAGRELVDTLHAVRRYGAIVRDLRGHGLKEAARYFGLARPGREYVPGPEVWRVYQAEPERVRRYALDDVREADALSRLLLAPSFALAAMVPKPYERVATAGTGQGLIEPLLVRAYVTARHSLPRAPGEGGSYAGAHTALFRTGIFHRIVKADVASLYPSIMLTYGIRPRTDRLGVFLALLRELTALRLQHKAAARQLAPDDPQRAHHEAVQAAMKVLINSFYGSLGTSFALFGDLEAAGQVTARGREILAQILRELEARGVTLIEADTDGVLFSVPEGWTEADERRLIEEVAAALPAGIQVEHDGRYERMYSHAAKNYVLRGYDGRIRMVGVAFRSSRSEPYGEQFLTAAMPYILAEDLEGLRRLYLDWVARLRRRAVPVHDLCVTMPLTKSPERYRASRRREEAYEVLLAAGRTSWRVGERVQYYQAVGGRKKLVEDYADDYDPEPYVRKLRTTYAQRLVHALGEETLRAVFAEPAPEATSIQPALFEL
ncbi:MAG TPA: DNA polymerase domain-containing protein [Chloroflexota bacterium]|nr:DNA polymerase domain-containing protein [Chloroflexota bacterium]